jgi:hypothetical protein
MDFRRKNSRIRPKQGTDWLNLKAIPLRITPLFIALALGAKQAYVGQTGGLQSTVLVDYRYAEISRRD